jgi:glutamine synthetase
MEKNRQEMILRAAEEEDVEFIRLQFTDMFGTLKNIAVTFSQLEKALSGQCHFPGTALEGFPWDGSQDLYLYPDPDSFVLLPWRPQQGKVARMLCDVRYGDGKPFEGCSRSILKNVLRDAASQGYSFYIGSECEFFLFQTDEEGQPAPYTPERAGCFDAGPMDTGENARRDMVLTLEDMGFQVESSYHEAAPGQHEIDFHWAEGTAAADSLVTFKFAVRMIARRHGLYATFMPKPRTGIPGSGMHLNFALYNNEGKNLFHDSRDAMELSDEARWFVGGLLAHTKGMSLITNPLVNSYKRLVPGYEAPVYESWSAGGRSTLIRIPAARGQHTQVELQSPDPSANPYLALAVCLASGMDGIRRHLKPPVPVDGSSGRLAEEELCRSGVSRLPASLGEAAEAFEKDSFLRGVLGESLSRRYLEAKKQEWKEYMSQVTDWEVENYLYRI